MARSICFTRPGWAAALSLLAACLSLTQGACTRSAEQDATVVFWAMGSEAEMADAVLEGFRRQRPDLPVRVQRVPWSAAHEKLLTAYVGRSMPDVFQLGNTWLAEFETLGALEPLDSRVAASPTTARDDFFAGALDPNVIDGRLVALPWYVDTRLLFYRRDLLAKVGAVDVPSSWQDWKAAMTRVRGDVSNPGNSTYGIFLSVDEWQTPVILALQQGASLLRDQDRYGNFRSAEVRRAWEFYASLFRDGLAPTRSEAQVTNLYREFAAGYFAFFVTGPWNLGELARRMPPEMASAWTTAPMPSPTGNGIGLSLAGGSSLAVSSASPRKDAAWKVVEYLESPAAQKQLRDRSGDLPSRRSAWAGGTADEKAAAFRVQLDHLAATPKVPEWERIAAKITLHLERVVRGDEDLDAALVALDADVDLILAKRRSMMAAAPLGRAGR